MKVSGFGRYALCTCVAVAVLSGCGGNASTGATPPVSDAAKKLPFHKTFNYTGAEQTFNVPAGVRKLTVVAVGARGGGEDYESRNIQSFGGRVWAIVPVTPGEKLAIFVGGQGSQPSGGFNGGGSGTGKLEGYGGGGASDVRQGGDTLNDRILVVGGGGGAAPFASPEYGGLGGNGGGSVGGAGTDSASGSGFNGGYGGGGGTQLGGGAGGNGGGISSSGGDPGSPGSLGVGGSGGQGGGFVYAGRGGGGGGGGYYGGGGGGGGGGYYGGGGGGGGGGSSYVEPNAYAYRSWQGWKEIHTANGLIVISWQ
jgi:hypothetical protein